MVAAWYFKLFFTSILIILVPANKASNSSNSFNGAPPFVRSRLKAPDILSALFVAPG